jgi:NADH dehydrogenase
MRTYPVRNSRPAAPRILVAGGTGFIGRHAVAALRDAGAAPIVGSRFEPGERVQTGSLTDDCARRVLRFEDLGRVERWLPQLEGVDGVLNCVGILRPRGRASYERVHHRAVAALGAACAQRGIRVVHVSALGLDAPARSGFLRSKRDGEQALMASGADWWIARPALLDGEGGFGARWIRRVADWPLHPLPGDARGLLAPLDVRDLAIALARLCLDPPATGADPRARIFELGGADLRRMDEHLDAMRDPTLGPRAPRIPVPAALARLCSHACDLLHATPFSFGHLELLRRDNVPCPNRITELLGRAPRAVVRGARDAQSLLVPPRVPRLAPRG